MNISVIRATLYDVKAITALTQELDYTANESNTQEWLGYILDSSNNDVFVAVSDATLCGWVVVEKRISLQAGFKAEITGLVVDARYRRLGVGYQLVQAAEVWAAELGLTRLAVSSNVARDASHAFYLSLGFDLIKTSHNYQESVCN